ncbi:MAG: CPBP family intramembrane metalloprotease [Planctomycetaceae bacterium]|nr:CPBP family intramembrane metalloprotease [Planctomycetaceae bacterium]
MSWTNVKLVFFREVRDQLRDRRTLFMIFVLPVVLYPLLGLSFFQFAQFIHKHTIKALVLGAEGLPATPALIEDGHFAAAWFTEPDEPRLVELTLPEASPSDDGEAQAADSIPRSLEEAKRQVRAGTYDVLIYFPPDFSDRLVQSRAQIAGEAAKEGAPAPARAPPDLLAIPSPEVYYNSALEKSQLGYLRVLDVLVHWRAGVGRTNLEAGGLPPQAAEPFRVAKHDVADPGRGQSAVWAKVFPFLLLIWAMTGAFYPAIDLCAGEKERGTLETLLSSPAARVEIVGGKLCTVMLFSATTVLLNLLSMGITGMFVLSQLQHIGPPPLLAIVWLLIALIPISALFSALCLALAAFARSTKEGQYYLMPLLLITMPLVVIAILPGVELNLGNSLIPVTGVVLLLRTVLEGNYWQALPFVPPVVGVTLVGCLLAIRWAVDQFNTETVLFRESERLDLGLWLRNLLRDRDDTPSVSEAVFCGVLILVIWFFMSFALPAPTSFAEFAELALVTQLVVIATPALLMTVMLTRSPRKTLLLNRPAVLAVPAALLLATLLHPVVAALQLAVTRLYPVDSRIVEMLSGIFTERHPLWQLVLVFAVAPAIAEELAFRGFILSGFRRSGHKWRAIVLSSIFFGMTHGIFQQSLVAILLGIVIGYIAVQSGSILPGMLFHLVHNALRISLLHLSPEDLSRHPSLGWLVQSASGEGISYHPAVVVAGALGAAAILYWFHRQPYERTAEEILQDAIRHNSAAAAAA